MNVFKNIISLLWQDFINFIHLFPKNSGEEDVVAYTKTLKRDGIIKIKNYIPASFADSLRKQLKQLAEKHPKSVRLDNGVKFNYRNQDNPNGADAGMLDIYFAERLIPEISNIKQDKIIKILKNTTGQKVIPLRSNAYINRGVKNTRVFHIDNAQPVIYKAFIYLTDVSDTSFGPYSFVKASHRLSLYPYINLFRNLFRNLFSKRRRSTDMPFYKKRNAIPAIGKKGDLILSNQNGIHRGLPQEEGKERVALILSFMIKSRLSYIHGSARQSIAKSKAEARSANAV